MNISKNYCRSLTHNLLVDFFLRQWPFSWRSGWLNVHYPLLRSGPVEMRIFQTWFPLFCRIRRNPTSCWPAPSTRRRRTTSRRWNGRHAKTNSHIPRRSPRRRRWTTRPAPRIRTRIRRRWTTLCPWSPKRRKPDWKCSHDSDVRSRKTVQLRTCTANRRRVNGHRLEKFKILLSFKKRRRRSQ